MRHCYVPYCVDSLCPLYVLRSREKPESCQWEFNRKIKLNRKCAEAAYTTVRYEFERK